MTEEPKLVEIPNWMPENGLGICGTLLMRMPPEQARALLDRLSAKTDEDASTMRLIQKPKPSK